MQISFPSFRSDLCQMKFFSDTKPFRYTFYSCNFLTLTWSTGFRYQLPDHGGQHNLFLLDKLQWQPAIQPFTNSFKFIYALADNNVFSHFIKFTFAFCRLPANTHKMQK